MRKVLVLLVLVLMMSVMVIGKDLLEIVMNTLVSVIQTVGYDPLLDYDVYTENIVVMVPLSGPILDKFTEGLSYDEKTGLDIFSLYMIVAMTKKASLYVPLSTVTINGNPVFLACDLSGNMISDIYLAPGEVNYYLLASLGKTTYPTIMWRGRYIDPLTSIFFMSLLETFGT